MKEVQKIPHFGGGFFLKKLNYSAIRRVIAASKFASG